MKLPTGCATRRVSDLASVNVLAIIWKSGMTIRQNRTISVMKTIILNGFVTRFRNWFFSLTLLNGLRTFPFTMNSFSWNAACYASVSETIDAPCFALE